MEKKINKVKCMAGKPINLFEHERLLVIHGKLVTKKHTKQGNRGDMSGHGSFSRLKCVVSVQF